MNACLSAPEFLSVSLCSSLDLLLLPVLIAPGKVCDRQNTKSLQTFLVFVLQVSELVELREFTEEVKGSTECLEER